ncbi:MAG: thioredoxin domain-containing protein [Proteobacteria bacterium]|nr:thioredoxin domain-containing protein [Pseudomonadota bacterium]
MAQGAKKTPLFAQPRTWIIAMLAVAVAGFAISIELSRIHYFTHTDPAYNAICALNDKVNCEQVARSPYAVFLFMPISWWGLAAYLALATIAAAAWRVGRRHRGFGAGILFVAALLSVVVAGILAWISHFIIQSLCLFCMSLYFVNLILLVAAALLLRALRQNPVAAVVADVRHLLRQPALIALFAAVALIPSALVAWKLPVYWQHLGWKELPALPAGIDPNGAHWIGAAKPVLTIYEFSDYQCPYCRFAHKSARTMITAHADKVRLVHKHFPVDAACNETVRTTFHDRACEFALAAECASQQNQFWAMNDALFAIQDRVRPEKIDPVYLAEQLGLDMPRFRACLTSAEPLARIRQNVDEGIHRKVRGTPTFFIGAQPYAGGFSPEVLRNALQVYEAMSQDRAAP